MKKILHSAQDDRHIGVILDEAKNLFRLKSEQYRHFPCVPQNGAPLCEPIILSQSKSEVEKTCIIILIHDPKKVWSCLKNDRGPGVVAAAFKAATMSDINRRCPAQYPSPSFLRQPEPSPLGKVARRRRVG